MSDELEFSTDWFSWAPEVWEKLIPSMSARKRVLEIGSYEGRSTAWIIEHMLEDHGTVVCVDTWEGGEEHNRAGMPSVEKAFDRNMGVMAERFPHRYASKVRSDSYSALSAMGQSEKGTFDFVYIDGAHTAPGVLTDACLAWPLLKPGGFMVFDDYLWGDARDVLHRPRIAIDTFATIFAEDLSVLFSGYQYGIRKNV